MTDTSRTTIHTFMGRSIDLSYVRVEDIDLKDITWSLGGQTRFNGHTIDQAWTVLHHSMLTAELAYYFGGREYYESALLHDAHEAYVGDIATPVKNLLGEECGVLTRELDGAIIARFGLPNGAFEEPAIKKADNMALVVEAYALLDTKGVPDIVPECFQPVEWATEIFETVRRRSVTDLRSQFDDIFAHVR